MEMANQTQRVLTLKEDMATLNPQTIVNLRGQIKCVTEQLLPALGHPTGAHIQDQDTVKRTVMGMVSQTQPVQTQLEILVSLNPQTNVNIHGQMEIVKSVNFPKS